MRHRSIAIDGPSGAGKSTLAKALAEALGFLYVDTGAIYRTVGLQAFRAGVDPSDPQAVIPLLKALDIAMKYGSDGLQHMYLNGEDVTAEIRRHEISAFASAVSAIPEVRAFLMEQAAEPGPGARCGHGRPRHRDRGAAGGRRQDLPHRRPRRSGPAAAGWSCSSAASRRIMRPFSGM